MARPAAPSPAEVTRAAAPPAASQPTAPPMLPAPSALPDRLPPPVARAATPAREAGRGEGRSNRRLAFVVLLLSLGGAALALMQEPRSWRLAAWPLSPATAAPQPTRHPAPPPSPVALEALSAFAAAPEGDNPAWTNSLRQLTLEPCCAGAWWSADSSSLLYMDRPDGQQESAIYRLKVWPPGALPEPAGGDALSLGLGQPRFAARPEGEVSVVQDLETGAEWQLPTGGNPTLVAPDGSVAAWFTGKGGRAEVDGFNSFAMARLDGSEGRDLGGLWGGSLVRFLPDSRYLLALGRPAAGRALYELRRIDLATTEAAVLAQGMWLSEVALSPSGAWVAYLISLDSADPAANGVWVAPTEPGAKAPRKLELHGAYRWRDGDRLVFVPQLPGASGHALLEFDARSGRSRVLVDPARQSLRIADNDWSVSPDGKRLAFRSQDDRMIWVLDLPE